MIRLSRGDKAIEVSLAGSDLAQEAAVAMAKTSIYWGYGGSADQLLQELLSTASNPGGGKIYSDQQLEAMKANAQRMVILERLARNFRQVLESEGSALPSFEPGDQPREVLMDYCHSLGVRVDFSVEVPNG